MLYSNAYWKSVARKALQGHWLTAMLIALVVIFRDELTALVNSIFGSIADKAESIYG